MEAGDLAEHLYVLPLCTVLHQKNALIFILTAVKPCILNNDALYNSNCSVFSGRVVGEQVVGKDVEVVGA